MGKKICYYCGNFKDGNAMLMTLRVPTHHFTCDCDEKIEIGLYIRNGNKLHLADTEDNNCLDSGEYIEINFCPMCGCEL